MKTIIKKIYEEKELTSKQNKKVIEYISSQSISRNDLFNIERTSDNFFIYTIINNDLFNSVFRSHIDKSLTNRESRTLEGDSHKSKCSKGLLSMRIKNKDINGIFYELPEETTAPNSEHAVIIENLETFIKRDFISSLQINNIESSNIIFGSGGSTTNAYFMDFLSKYKTVTCLFDWDEKGFSFYETLLKAGVNAIWHYEELFLNRFKTGLKKKTITLGKANEIIARYKHLPHLSETLSIIKETRSIQEQEIFQIK